MSTPEHAASAADAPPPRIADLGTLKALGHPLRMQIFDALSLHGAATSSMLAERLGESSGAMSYHLRQLAQYDLVREVVGRGTARERWWERTPGGLTVPPDHASDPAVKAAAQVVMDHVQHERESHLREFLDRGMRDLPDEWLHASVMSTAHLRLTCEQLDEASSELAHAVEAIVARYRGLDLPGSRPVELQLNAFPLVDGEELPQ
ncbi:winged helix-turn-helix domain-containing protein [Agromyces mangrovi Wang et al. 2018]|uniref:winged helix-turn-helix domain-containing protein n=1 Tax=Agromyces mangrovi TaxID=1858653 RepID=UPI002573A11E|nr:helix-turn-helix domain-containing protein [Agromyces mangrovi]